MDDLLTSHSIEGRDVPDFEMLYAKKACVLRKIIANSNFRRRVSVAEWRAQKHYRFLRGRQFAYMIYDHFRATGAYDAAHDLSVFFNINLHDGDIQVFDTRWDQSSINSMWDTSGECPWRSVQIDNTRVCSASNSIGYVRPRNGSRSSNAKLSKNWRPW